MVTWGGLDNRKKEHFEAGDKCRLWTRRPPSCIFALEGFCGMNRVNFAVGVLFICFSLVYYFYLIPTQIISSVTENEYAGRIFRAETFPQMAIMLFAFVSALLALNALRERGGSEVMPGTDRRALYQAFVVFSVGVFYIYGLQLFGFAISSPFFLAVLVMFFGTRDWRYVVGVALLVPPAVNYFFWYSFKVILPEGSVF